MEESKSRKRRGGAPPVPPAPEDTKDYTRTDWRRTIEGEEVRIAVRHGGTTKADRDAAHALFTELWEDGQTEALRLLQRGGRHGLSVPEVRRMRREGRLTQAHLTERVVLARPLWETLEASARRLGRAEGTRKGYAAVVRKLRARAGEWLGPNARVRDLGTVDWVALRARWTATRGAGDARCEQPASAANWNRLGSFLASVLTDLFGGRRTGKAHPFRRQVLDRFPTEKEYEREITISVDDFVALLAEVPEHLRAGVLVLALTGIRVSEWLGLTEADLRPGADPPAFVVVGKGGKPATVRVDPMLWPWVAAAVPAPVSSRAAVWLAVKKAAIRAGHPELRVHDLRHLTAVAAMAAGAGLNAVRDQLRHEDSKTTMRYLRQANQREAATALARAFAPVLRAVGDGKR